MVRVVVADAGEVADEGEVATAGVVVTAGGEDRHQKSLAGNVTCAEQKATKSLNAQNLVSFNTTFNIRFLKFKIN